MRNLMWILLTIAVGTDAHAAPKGGGKSSSQAVPDTGVTLDPAAAFAPLVLHEPLVDSRYQAVAPLTVDELLDALMAPPAGKPSSKGGKGGSKSKGSKGKGGGKGNTQEAPDPAAFGALRIAEIRVARGSRCGEAVQLDVDLVGGALGGAFTVRALETQMSDRGGALHNIINARYERCRLSDPQLYDRYRALLPSAPEVNAAGDLMPGERRTLQLATPWRFTCNAVRTPDGNWVTQAPPMPTFFVSIAGSTVEGRYQSTKIAPRQVVYEVHDYDAWVAGQ